MHVIAHEAGHAVLRAFDWPFLLPEEDFATAFIYRTLAEQAEAIIGARAAQHLADGATSGPYAGSGPIRRLRRMAAQRARDFHVQRPHRPDDRPTGALSSRRAAAD
ncbi:MAG: hypothetical protein AAF822_07435 [Pseudomonadota bacterium]